MFEQIIAVIIVVLILVIVGVRVCRGAGSSHAESMVDGSDPDVMTQAAVEGNTDTPPGAVPLAVVPLAQKIDNTDDVRALFEAQTLDTKLTADDRFVEKGRQISAHNQEAILNRTRFNSANAYKYFADELHAHETRAWWDEDDTEMDQAMMVKYRS